MMEQQNSRARPLPPILPCFGKRSSITQNPAAKPNLAAKTSVEIVGPATGLKLARSERIDHPPHQARKTYSFIRANGGRYATSAPSGA